MKAHPEPPDTPHSEPGLPRKGRELVLLAFAIAVSLVIAWFARHALLIVYVSAVFAVVVKPGVEWLHESSILGWRPDRGTALLLLVLVLFVFLGGLVAIAVPSMVSSASEFFSTMSSPIAGLQKRLQSLPLLRSLNFSDLQPHISAALKTVLPAVGGASADTLTALLLIAYFVLEGSALLKRTLCVLPVERRTRLEATLNRAGKRMRHWLVGQAMLMAILGSASALTFGLMGLPYFYLLGVFARDWQTSFHCLVRSLL